MAAVRIAISGRVQGVGFRAFVQRQAKIFGCVGEVWNRSDRSVEAVAYHPEPDVLDAFCKSLWDGPGHVTHVEVLREPEAHFVGFEIGLTR